jgi:hypothetical protein
MVANRRTVKKDRNGTLLDDASGLHENLLVVKEHPMVDHLALRTCQFLVPTGISLPGMQKILMAPWRKSP